MIADAIDARVDGVAATAIPLDDRGLLYGDGVFETMRASRGTIALWDWHWRRLVDGCTRLGIAPPSRAACKVDIAALAGEDDAVVKLIVTRGSGARGYAPPRHAHARRIVSRHALPSIDDARGLVLGWSRVVIADQPHLAGIKHLNRLEQVIARADCDDADADDAIACDARGDVVGVTSGNVFACIDGRWCTPPVDRCGIAGVCRAVLLEAGEAVPAITVAPVAREAFDRADAVVVTNAVRGVRAVARIGTRPIGDADGAGAFVAYLAGLGFPSHARALNAPRG